MIDYTITITDDDGDSVTFSHDYDAPNSLMVHASGLIVSDENTKVKTVMVILKKNHVRALRSFLDMAYGEILQAEAEQEESTND